ncbi:hypothetical protein SAMN05421753_115146 [Planctomicrobium piriforme]|uniref:Uncharacterized protein n=1 Tax=Planctomicrobium piriforme TaxID=1576369 RepID=A0A1I3NML7_9PLAN|nr:hypothetical protein SAMN05421753_115146 [Planctomicrobium piriforme]
MFTQFSDKGNRDIKQALTLVNIFADAIHLRCSFAHCFQVARAFRGGLGCFLHFCHCVAGVYCLSRHAHIFRHDPLCSQLESGINVQRNK